MYKDAIRELEEAQELNDELDAQQKEELEEARQSIAQLENVIHQYDKRLGERDSTVADREKTIAKLKGVVKGLMVKIEENELASSFASMEQRGLQARLLESGIPPSLPNISPISPISPIHPYTPLHSPIQLH